MRGFSKVVLAGNLTRDPELRTTPSGASVCAFTIAVNRNYKDASGAQQEQTSFIDCSAWGKAAELISQYVKKGRPLLVSGRLSQRSWEDKTTGQKRSRTEVVVEDFTFIDGGNSGGNATTMAPAAAAPATSSEAEVVPDDIPDGAAEVNIDDIPF